MTGRTLRPTPGKTDAIVLDHAGAVFQHGFIDDPIEWALTEDRRAENTVHSARGQYSPAALTICLECSSVRLQGQPCSACGWRPRAKPGPVVVADGELGEVGRGGHVRATEWSPSEQLAFYRQLLAIALQREYKPGWAANKFRERFGNFPPWAWNRAEPTQPCGAVTAWVRSRQIAYAKARVSV